MNLDEKLQLYANTVFDLKKLKAKEMEMRKELVCELFPKPDAGVNHFNESDNFIVKLSIGFNYSVDEAALPLVLKTMPEGTEDALIRYKPSLIMKEYSKLDDRNRFNMSKAVTMKPKSPVLEVTHIPQASVTL